MDETPGRSDTRKMDLRSEVSVLKTNELTSMKSGSQAAALTLLDPRHGISLLSCIFTLAAGSVFSERSNYFNVR